jgi:CheY-specific phosphatase CheX
MRFDEIVDGMLDQSCAEVFGDTPRRPGLPAGSVTCGHVAVIGFSGIHHRGHVGVALPVGTARRLHPLGEDRDESLVSDYVGELVNQLLGRVKVQFERYGLEVHAGTPVVLRGLELSIHACGNRSVTGCVVEAAGGALQVWIDVLTPDEITFEVEPVTSAEEHAEPGETLLF